LSESTSQEAKTIHRTLEFDPSIGGFRKDSSQPLEGDLFVVDETSMVDTVLMAHLVRAIPNHACLLLVGDVDQLPSVGPGRVLADLIESRKIPTARLTRIFRQAGVSLIVRAAHSVLHGELPVPSSNPKGDYFFVEAEQPQSVAEKILTMIHDRITIHKSQGSEYPVVVLPLHTQHFLMLQRNLLYTAITRGKKLVVVVGTRKALEIAISRQDNRHRYTSLILRLYQKAAH
ncbi:hypothetical protein EBX93_18245, partial [bacterium]|nr:hypothetical protein [bacterium]